MNIWRFITAAAMAAVIGSLGSPAGATTYTADFSIPLNPPGSPVNPLAATPYFQIPSPGYTADTADGYLSISKSATAAPTTGNLAVRIPFSITGNFSLTTIVDSSDVNSFAASGLLLRFSEGNSVQIYTNNSGMLSGSFHNFDTQADSNRNTVFGANGPVQIEVTRVGDTVTELYAPIGSTDFSAISTLSDASLLGSGMTYLWLMNTVGTTTAESARFRDVLVSPVPLPGGLLLFGTGIVCLAGLTKFARRKKSR